jgi:perosamine synthetase
VALDRVDNFDSLLRAFLTSREHSSPSKPTIPVARADLGPREEEMVVAAIRSGWLSSFEYRNRFERLLADKIRATHCVTASSGTSALHLCMRIAQIGTGDEVITTPLSYVATTNVILYQGATPVFVDTDPRTLNLNVDAVAAAITSRTKAVLTVDLFGYPSELDPLKELCDKYGLILIEDACQALGSNYKCLPCGSRDHLTTFSFSWNKQITTGEGGAVVGLRDDESKYLRSLLNQGRAVDGNGDYVALGYNYRMSELAAALGIAQMERFDDLLSKRRLLADYYNHHFQDRSELDIPCPDDEDHERSWFLYPIQLDANVDRAQVISRLMAVGVATRQFPCIHLLSYMSQRFGYRLGMFPNAELASRRLLAIPFASSMSFAERQAVVEDVLSACRQARRGSGCCYETRQ